MRKIASGLAAVSLLGALMGVLGSGSALAALSCRPVTGAVLVCTDTSQGTLAVVFSDVVVAEAALKYGNPATTGVFVADGFTNNGQGVLIYCDPSQHKYHLVTIVNNAYKDRTINRKCN